MSLKRTACTAVVLTLFTAFVNPQALAASQTHYYSNEANNAQMNKIPYQYTTELDRLFNKTKSTNPPSSSLAETRAKKTLQDIAEMNFISEQTAMAISAMAAPVATATMNINAADTNAVEKDLSKKEIKNIQNRLKELYYFNADSTGTYGPQTKKAMLAFQKANELTADGKANSQTLSVLFSSSAQSAPTKALVIAQPPVSDAVIEQSAPSSDTTESLIAFARTLLGRRYVRGAAGPKAFDCSGLTYYVFKNFGYTLPRTSFDQGYGKFGTKITSIDDLKPGDLVFFNTLRDKDLSDHVGIYIGDHKFINAENSGSCVVISDMSSGYWNIHFSWGKRILN